jgi:hypothetical protein
MEENLTDLDSPLQELRFRKGTVVRLALVASISSFTFGWQVG